MTTFFRSLFWVRFFFFLWGRGTSEQREADGSLGYVRYFKKMAFFLWLLDFWKLTHPQTFWARTYLAWGKPHEGARAMATETFGMAFAAISRYVFGGEKPCLQLGSRPPPLSQLCAPGSSANSSWNRISGHKLSSKLSWCEAMGGGGWEWMSLGTPASGGTLITLLE